MENITNRVDILAHDNCNTQPQLSNPRTFGLCISNVLHSRDKGCKAQLSPIEESIPPLIVDNSHTEYINDILIYSRELEVMRQGKFGYMENQGDITEKMRAILVDWLVDVHFKFNLMNETLYLTVNLLDRFLECKQIKRSQLQLVGITTLFIACKYEEIYPPEVRDLVYIADNTYSREKIKKMEVNIVKALNFNIGTATSYRFLEYFSTLLGIALKTKYIAQYFLELALVEYKALQYNDSLKAVMALYLADKTIIRWSKEIEEKIGYSKTDIKEHSNKFKELIKQSHKSTLNAVKKKFACSKYLAVSKILKKQ